MNHKNYLSNNMSLQQLMKITGSVSLITLLAFSQRGTLQAEETMVPLTMNRMNLDPIKIEVNDTKTIAHASKMILKDEVSLICDTRLIETTSTKDVYALGDYVVSVYYDKNIGLGLRNVKMTIETGFTHDRKSNQKLLLSNSNPSNDVFDGVVNEYNIVVNVVDTQAPVIVLSKDEVTVKTTDSFNIKNYIKSVYDNYDGELNYTVEGSIPRQNGGRTLDVGTHKLKISATDSSGNETTKTLTVTVKEPDKYFGKDTDTSNFKGGSYIVDAAYAQLGKKQDCTRLVSNSLAAAGINFHGWPIEYFKLGYEVSYAQAQPGDLIYYAVGGSNGLAHIAVYVGNGMSIHGGWNGNTVLYRYKYSTCSTPRFIRIK